LRALRDERPHQRLRVTPQLPPSRIDIAIYGVEHDKTITPLATIAKIHLDRPIVYFSNRANAFTTAD